MANPLTPIYAHSVWSTFDRKPTIEPAWEGELHRAIAKKCRELGCTMVEVNGMPNHVHLLVHLPPEFGYMKLVQQVKGVSSFLVNRQISPGTDFRWQGSYYGRSVDPDNVSVVRAYVRNQKLHHERGDTLDIWEQTEE